MEAEVKPDHVDGFCDVGGCNELAVQPLRDEDEEIYLEVCGEHAEELSEGFQSSYREVEADSPHRGPPKQRESHHCGGTLRVYSVEDGEYRVCSGCGYALLIEDGEGDGFSVRTA